ncbi:aminotransferase class IV family protein [Rhizobium wuzhouense]|uniref:Probable branched-chain-amino-acid aminotransferase n=1 Tax=Rhizobium wuzhouense TaxID=1986026 RepID=A0ABX5NUL7_9HYPH|nr:aminotransferase class IV family protein [Rhizobium wuzhouense]PYB73096.1 hypothetical protein DMY87_12275 [Rhizobium wuzhouense]
MDFSLIETMRWQPDAGFLRLDQHLRRLARSADALGFRQPQDARGKLEKEVSGDTPLRVRLVMSFRGKIEITTSPYIAEAEEAVWRVKVAKTRLQSEDSLFRHKTTRREPYEAARAEFSKDEADEVILLNERDEVCEGTITNIFAEAADGTLLTPPLTSGLLPGVLRAELIRERRARGEVLKLSDLSHRKLFVGNSLRGLIRAELIE